MSNRVIVVSVSSNESTGIGRHAISLERGYRDLNYDVRTLYLDKYKALTYLFLPLRHFVFFIFSFVLLFFYHRRGYVSISTSVICPINIDIVNVSGNHLYSVLNYTSGWVRKVLNPNNISSVPLEALHSIFSKTVYLSLVQMNEAQEIYGGRVHKNAILSPVLHSSLLHSVSNFELSNRDGIRLVFIAHNFRLKGLDLVIPLLKSNRDLSLDVIGEDHLFRVTHKDLYKWAENSGQIRFLGKQAFCDINLGVYDLFIYPSRLDSYGFVVQECIRAGLPCIVSDRTGAADDFSVFLKDFFCFSLADFKDGLPVSSLINKFSDDLAFRKLVLYEVSRLSKSYNIHRYCEDLISLIDN